MCAAEITQHLDQTNEPTRCCLLLLDHKGISVPPLTFVTEMFKWIFTTVHTSITRNWVYAVDPANYDIPEENKHSVAENKTAKNDTSHWSGNLPHSNQTSRVQRLYRLSCESVILSPICGFEAWQGITRILHSCRDYTGKSHTQISWAG